MMYVYIYMCIQVKSMYNMYIYIHRQIIYIYTYLYNILYIHVFSLVGSFLARTCTGFGVQMECLGVKVKLRLAEICRI